MKSALKLFIIGCLVLIFCQCSMNKDSYLKDFEKFITQTEKNCTTLSDPEWEKIQARFNDDTEKYYEQFKEELSVNEKISISILKSKFSTLILKRESKKIQEEMKIK